MTAGAETSELLARLRARDVSPATLDGLRVAADRLGRDYPRVPAHLLRSDGRTWLQLIRPLLTVRPSGAHHDDLLSVASVVAVLVGCSEHDMGHRPRAEVARRLAMALAEEAGDSAQLGWGFEMRAWFDLEAGQYRAALAAAEAGLRVTSRSHAAVQLAAQEANAWAYLGERRQVEEALEHSRGVHRLLPRPEHPEHHLVIDEAKLHLHAANCYRVLGVNELAASSAYEVIRTSTRPDGSVAHPMRVAQAKLTLAVVAARTGDLEGAVEQGTEALIGDRKSLPSLVTASRELVGTLQQHYAKEPRAAQYIERVRSASVSASATRPARPHVSRQASGRAARSA